MPHLLKDKLSLKDLDIQIKIIFDFLLCDSADFCIFISHRNISKLIQITKNTYLAEFCNSGEHVKTKVLIAIFKGRKKGLVQIAVGFLLLWIYSHVF